MAPKSMLSAQANNPQLPAVVRMEAQIQQVINRGAPVQRYRTNLGQFVRAEDGRRITLITADSKPTAEGLRYYELLGVPPPLLYNYDQPLWNDKWVRANDGSKILVRVPKLVL